MKSGSTKNILFSKSLQQLATQLSQDKIELLDSLVVKQFELYGVKTTSVDGLLQGPDSFKFYPDVMAIQTKQNLKQAATMVLPNGEVIDEKKPLKSIETAAISFLPSIMQVLLKHFNATQLKTDLSLQFEGVETLHNIQISCLKQNPRNLPEEAAGFILAGDSLDQIQKKINKGFCEDKNVAENPVLENLQIVFMFLKVVKINDVEYTEYEQVKNAFAEGKIDPKSLKAAVVDGFKAFYIENEEVAKVAAELLKKK